MHKLAHLHLADGVFLLLDDPVAEMTAEELALTESDRVAIIQSNPVAHRHFTDVDGPGGAQHLDRTGLLRVVALDAQQDLTFGILREQNVAIVEQLRLV